jgi:hypothetical protein
LPDIVRVVQRTGGDILECLFEAEEKWHRSLVNQYGYSLVPVRGNLLLDIDDDEEKQKQLLVLKKKVLEKVINQEQVSAGNKMLGADLLSDRGERRVFKHRSFVVDKDHLPRDLRTKRKIDEIDHLGDNVAEETTNTIENPSKIKRRRFYPATNNEILLAESAFETLVQRSREEEKPKQAEIWKKVHALTGEDSKYFPISMNAKTDTLFSRTEI